MSTIAELFPPGTGQMDSPKIRWLKKHQLVTWRVEIKVGGTIMTWACGDSRHRGRKEIGLGETEDEACAAMAIQDGIKLWNEETA